MKAFLGVNYVMLVIELPKMAIYWGCLHFIGNVRIQNICKRTRYQKALQNTHFADNSNKNQSDKGYKIRPIIDHLNQSSQSSPSNETEQNIDKHMTKVKGRSSMRQYLKMKPKCGFKWYFRYADFNGYLFETECLGQFR